MVFKQPEQIIDKRFQMEGPDNKVFWIPEQGEANTMTELVSLCIAQMTAFDRQGTPYTIPITRQAASLGLKLRPFLEKAIEHQICTRHPEKCFQDGLGDQIHALAVKTDAAIQKLPSTFRALGQAAVKVATLAATGKAQKKMGGCQTCGGSKIITPNRPILGRAGKLNSLTKKQS